MKIASRPTWPLLLACGALLLSSCAPTLRLSAPTTSLSVPATNEFCAIAKPITFNARDTDKTLAQIKAHNAVWAKLCR